jgi:hypothetical protein
MSFWALERLVCASRQWRKTDYVLEKERGDSMLAVEVTEVLERQMWFEAVEG